MNDVIVLLKVLYKDFFEKKSEYKILKDNIKGEIEVLEKTIENASEFNDESKLFSPRNNENDYVSVEELKYNLDEKHNVYNEYCSEYDYYNDYCKKIKEIIKNEEKKKDENSHDINELMYGSKNNENEKVNNTEKNNEKEISNSEYSLNLNYDTEELKNKILNIKHKSETCLKIFNNDKGRTKQEIISINKALDNLLKSL